MDQEALTMGPANLGGPGLNHSPSPTSDAAYAVNLAKAANVERSPCILGHEFMNSDYKINILTLELS